MKFKSILIYLTTFCFTSILYSKDIQVIHLTPPVISSATIADKIACTYPLRESQYNISLEQKKDKTLVHCYGQGEYRWNTLFGSVKKAIKLLKEQNISKETPIRVIGAGCMGLTTAIELDRLGYKVNGIYTQSIFDNVSWKASHYLTIPVGNGTDEENKDLHAIALNTFIGYRRIAKGDHPYITKEAIESLPIYCTNGLDLGLDNLVKDGLIPSKELVTLDFGNGIVHQGFTKYITYYLNATTLMRQLTDEVNQRNIPIEIKKVTQFSDVAEEVIFNCTGLGAAKLVQDKNLSAVKTHFITLNEEAGKKHMNYMIFAKVSQEGQDEIVSLFPKNISVTREHPGGIQCFGVLGGTFIKESNKLNADDKKHLNQTAFQKMLNRTSEFFQGYSFQ